MDKIRTLIRPFGKKPLLVTLAFVLLLTTTLSIAAPSQQSEAEREKIGRQVAQKWVQIGTEQYDRGFFKASEQSFLRAREYTQYLSAAEREKLSKLLEKSHAAVVEREKILSRIQAAERLIKQNKLSEAKTSLGAIKDSEFLTKDEQKLIAERFKTIDNQLKAAPSVEMEGQKSPSEAAVAAVGEIKNEEGTLGAVEDKLAGVGTKLAQPAEQKGVQEGTSPPEQQAVGRETKVTVVSVPESAREEGNYIEVINRKRNILRSHTKAVVNDAVTKAQNYINQGEFDKAKEAIEAAERAVNRNQLQLGDDVYKQYNSQLKQLSETITQKQGESTRQSQEQKQAEAISAQRRYREQMETDRKKRIKELMGNAMTYQKQQRYEEALGQLENLLAIDPLNNDSLILKQTLEDTINFRKQLEIQKEADKERVASLIGVEESLIPYAEELTYPKNWREIVAKRKPGEAIGQDPASAAVYKQLDEVVNLSALTPEMSFGEAIEILKGSVEPPLKIFVSWRDLYDNADIDRTTPINMDAISAIPLNTAFELLLKSVSGGFVVLGYTIDAGVIKIATAEELGSKLETLVYEVTDLLGRPADYYAQATSDITADVETAGGAGFESQDERDRDELAQEAAERAQNLIILIQETVEPSSWYDAGGEGTVRIHANKKLIVRQTREVHKKVEALLTEMRKALGHQVAIEARFLVVGENFLEDIGMNINVNKVGRYGSVVNWREDPDTITAYTDEQLMDPVTGKPLFDSEGRPQMRPVSYQIPGTGDPIYTSGIVNPNKFGFDQHHWNQTILSDTGITGSWPSVLMAGGEGGMVPGLAMGFGGVILDNLQVDFLLRASQAHRDAKSLTAPRISVISGESAALRVQKVTFYPAELEFDVEEIGEFGDYRFTIDWEDRAYVVGTLLNITPTITADKRNVLLNIVTELRDYLGMKTYTITGPVTAAYARPEWNIWYPETELSRIETRVCVPDGGTLLLGGQKLTAEIELESGVPILSKIPFLGRLFSNRSKVKDQKILLILVKPTIILQEEAEAKAIAAME